MRARRGQRARAAVDPTARAHAVEVGGSISAEHGIGQCKPQYLESIKPKPVVDLMHRLKRELDPHGILNPYKVLLPR